MRSIITLLPGITMNGSSKVYRERSFYPSAFSQSGEGPDIFFVHAEVLDQRRWKPLVLLS